ncbi:class I SAM-dependent methyltransferase [Nonomuraea sp. KM90]|uniref:class I SAM-dependent methyltransferase n=1 Tax=Nonomuraea sp. KM90 TaxID=3457428 RepID=UPI003FCEA53D
MRLPAAYDSAWLPRLTTPQRGTSHRGDTATLLGALWRNPRQIGTIAPSARALAHVAADVVPTTGAPIVVELGAGSGAITDVIAARLPPDGRLLAVEINHDLVRHLSRSRPWLQVLAGDAAGLTHLLRDAEVDRVDAIVSALPWTLLPAGHRRRILAEIGDVLAPDGIISTIATLTAWPTRSCRVFRRQLGSVFGDIQIRGPIWAAVPPAVVLNCRKPLHG